MTRRESIHSLIFIFSALLIVVTLPFAIRWCSIAIIIFTANWILEGGFKEKLQKIKTRPLIWLFVGMFLIYLPGLFYSQELQTGFFNIEKKLSLLIFPLILGTSRQLKGQEQGWILASFAGACLLAVVIAFINTLSRDAVDYPAMLNFDFFNAAKYNEAFHNPPAIWNYISYTGIGSAIGLHPTYFSMYLVFVMMILIYLRYQTGYLAGQKRKFIAMTILILLLGMTVMLSSRIVLLYLVICACWFIYHLFIRRRKYFIGILSGILFLGFIFSLIYLNPVSRYRIIEEPVNLSLKYVQHPEEWNSLNLRILEWNSSGRIINQNWLTGVGTGDTGVEMEKEYEKVDLGIFGTEYNSHNQFLQVFVELGVFGLLILSVSFLYPVFVAYKKKSKFYIVFMSLVLMCCLTESLLETQKGVVFYGFFNSLLIFQICKLDEKNG